MAIGENSLSNNFKELYEGRELSLQTCKLVFENKQLTQILDLCDQCVHANKREVNAEKLKLNNNILECFVIETDDEEFSIKSL